MLRNLEEEIDILRRDEESSRQKVMQLSSLVQNNEIELRNEEAKLISTRRDLTSVSGEICTLESEKEPEPTDVLALVFFKIFYFILFFKTTPIY